MSSLGVEENNYLTRMRLELAALNGSSVSTNLQAELESLAKYRTEDALTLSEFIVQLKKLEFRALESRGPSREAFLAFVTSELESSHASKDVFSLVARLAGSAKTELTGAMRSDLIDCCVMSWRAALNDAERDAKSGQFVAKVLVVCLVAYLVLTKMATVISEAKYPFVSEMNLTHHSPLWHSVSESVIRVLSYLSASGEIAPMIMGVGGAALSLFRKGVQSFEVTIMFSGQIKRSVGVHLAIGAWSGFVAGYLLTFLTGNLDRHAPGTGSLINFVQAVGCFAAGYSSWFIDTAIDRVWKTVRFTPHPKFAGNLELDK
jgi:hypothetical protein